MFFESLKTLTVQACRIANSYEMREQILRQQHELAVKKFKHKKKIDYLTLARLLEKNPASCVSLEDAFKKMKILENTCFQKQNK